MSALAEALVAAQAELPAAIARDADGEIGGRSYKYLTLDKLIAATKPILQAHGLTIHQWPCVIRRAVTQPGSQDNAGEALSPGLQTVIQHTSGEMFKQTMPLYLTDKSMQGLGSAITYARRYAWASALGIAAEEDDDAKDSIPF